MARKSGRRYADTRLARYLDKRVLELRPRKTQAQIATEAGFVGVNMMAMVKTGAAKLPLDRVPTLAQALECDPAYLFMMALEQQDNALPRAIETIFGTPVTKNEIAWLELIREASDYSDPHVTTKPRKALMGVFGK